MNGSLLLGSGSFFILSHTPLIVGFVVEAPVDIVRFYDVDKGGVVDFHYFFYEDFCFFAGNDGINHAGFFACEAAPAFQTGGRMVGHMGNFFINFLGFPGDDKQGVLFVALMQHLDYLGGGELENDGIQRSVPAEEKSCNYKNRGIGAQDVIPDVAILFFGKIDGDKICTAAAGIANQAQADAKAVNQSAENADKQRIVCNGLCRDNICQNTGENDDTAGTDGKSFADELEADANRDGIKENVNKRIRNLNAHKFHKDIL